MGYLFCWVFVYVLCFCLSYIVCEYFDKVYYFYIIVVLSANNHFLIFCCVPNFQIKCNRKLNLTDEVIEESDEEINRLKQKIRCRRRQKLHVEQTKSLGTSSSDCLTECKSFLTFVYSEISL